jgi:hypothetical protein
MRVLLLLVIVSLNAESPCAQEFERFIGGPDHDRGVFVSPTADGGYAVVGVTESFGEGGEDVYLVKTDAHGELLWSMTYGGNEEDNGWSVREVADGFVIAGFTKSFGEGAYDYYLVKTDADGKTQWTRTFGGEGDDRCWALIVTRDGGYLLAGETTSVGAGDRDAYVGKISATGDMEWSKTFGGEASDVGHYIAQTDDGNFLVTGYTTSLAEKDDDPYLIKINANGETQWTSVPTMAGINHTLTGEQAADGGYYLVGFTKYPERRAFAGLLVKLDGEGNLEWHEDFLTTYRGQSSGYTLRATGDGGCVFTGQSTVGGAGNLDVLLVKVADEDR